MSAPKTNMDKQARQHWGPLVGISLVVIFALSAMAVWLTQEAANGDNPNGVEEGTQEYVPATETVVPERPATTP